MANIEEGQTSSEACEAGPSGMVASPDKIHIEDEDIKRKEHTSSSSFQEEGKDSFV